MITEFGGRRVTVMGLGRFGGGVGAVRFLAERGAQVTVTDLKPAGELAASLEQIRDCAGVTLRLGEHREADFRACDLVVVSPAVPTDNRFVQLARDAGVPVTSEMNLFWERNRGRTIAVTGSNGKSTTAAMIHALLGGTSDSPAPGRVWLGGNIGVSLLPEVERIAPEDRVVLELSSFQLEALAPLRPNPHVAVVTNFSPNHLDRHGTLEAYRLAKQNILRWQTADRLAVLNQSDPDVAAWTTEARTFWFGRDDEGRQGLFALGPFEPFRQRALFRHALREQVLPLADWLRLPGAHNFQNALAATCAALALETTTAEVAQRLGAFAGLPHRLQLVADTAGRKFYNDSKATTPAAALRALESFRAPLVLLAGGYDKQLDLAPLALGIVQQHVKAVALMGQTAGRLQSQIAAAGGSRVATQVCGSLEAAFAWAAAQSAPGDIVLLSPGCASYDWFPDYEARGAEFAQRARAWAPSEHAP